MARQTSAIEFSNFIAGLITEASPLTFPDNASLDEQNFVLRRDGSRRRRLGIDYEEDFLEINTGITVDNSSELAIKSFKWENAGGNAKKVYTVVQVGNELRIFDATKSPLSRQLVYTKAFTGASKSDEYSFAVVDGLLVVATGQPTVFALENKGNSFVEKSYRLLIRDLFGVADTISGVNLRLGTGIATRPATTSNAHTYNLRNQTWAEPRLSATTGLVDDTISNFRTIAGAYPSNADITTYSIYPDANNEDDRLTDRFNPNDVVKNPIGTTPASQGYFIIDALNRGVSRLEEVIKLKSRYPELGNPVTNLPKDTTSGGPTRLAEFAGRVFYAGFNGDVTDGDDNSPKMSSYLLFSKLVDDTSDLNACYQEGDPTSKEEPDILDTDGGFIRIDGAYGIQGLYNIGQALLVVATNGVWTIQGGSDYGFKATNYLVSKVTNYGCNSPGSIVVVDTSLMYWSEDGIYVVAQNQFGDYVADNLTQKTIQTYFESIDSVDRAYAKAVYDSYERKVTWTYGNRVLSTGGVKQLVFDTTLGAFYPFVFNGPKYPMLVSGVNTPPYRIQEIDDDVTVNGEDVTASGIQVTVNIQLEQGALNETSYLTITRVSPTVRFTFSSFRDPTFTDWISSNGIGYDASAFLLTGWMSAGDHQRDKQVPYVTFHFIKTETGFEEVEGGDWDTTGKSSCLVSPQWEWANSVNSGRWGREFQAYRLTRHYFPADLSDSFNNGFYTVVTKNKLRGKGKVLSLLMRTEPKKDCYLLGWSMLVGVNGTV